jgi:hypothetical protein
MSDASGDKRRESDDGKSQGASFIENPKFQAKMIPAALHLLLFTLDECRYVLRSAHSSNPRPSSSAIPEYGRNLPARERKILDQAVNEYVADLAKTLSRKFAETENASDDRTAENSMYPFSPETELFFVGQFSSEFNAELINKHFSPFFDDPVFLEYILAKVRLGSDEKREAIVGAALLPLIVSSTEEFLGAIVRTGLGLYPLALGEPPSVPNDILIKYQRNISTADIRRWQIDRQVAQFIMSSPNEWAKPLERWTRIDITNIGADWDMLSEMIQRRHVIVHNGGRADADYLSKVAPRLRRGLYPGSKLTCDSAYLQPVLIELETWAICLALRFSKHFFKEEASVYDQIINRVIHLEELGRWTQGLAIMDSFLLDPVPIESDRIILAQTNRWYCLQELGKDNESIRREIQSWRPSQSMTQNDAEYLEIGRMALLRDYEGLVTALNGYFKGPDMQKRKRRVGEYPLIRRAMQESPRVRSFFRSGWQSSSKVRHSASRPRGAKRPPRRS